MLQPSGKQEQLQSSPNLGPAFYTLYRLVQHLIAVPAHKIVARAGGRGRGWRARDGMGLLPKIGQQNFTSDERASRAEDKHRVRSSYSIVILLGTPSRNLVDK